MPLLGWQFCYAHIMLPNIFYAKFSYAHIFYAKKLFYDSKLFYTNKIFYFLGPKM